MSAANLIPLGVTINNPGNLRPLPPPDAWKGQTATAKGFAAFATPVMGARALLLDLVNKQHRDGLDTVTDIITKYAPPSENNTAAYIADVAEALGVHRLTPLIPQVETVSLAMAISSHELGGTWYGRKLWNVARIMLEDEGLWFPT